MRVDRVRVENLRNIREIEFVPDPALTVIAGENGQGKTNLLECIWLLTGSKSFRGAKDTQLVREGEDFGRVEAETHDGDADNAISVVVGSPESGRRGRRAKVNGVEYGRATAIAGKFTAVVFEPGHLRLVQGGPEGRRRFLDAALCQLYPGYIGTLRRYQRALTQKNALLKKSFAVPDADSLLDAFDIELAATGEEMSRRRRDYLEQLAPLAARFYGELAGGREALEVCHLPCCAAGGMAEGLRAARREDRRAGFSTFGPHREDLTTVIEGRPAKSFGSQGQQRSAVLALKLAEAECARQVTGQHPVMLLDDVLSELDEGRQSYLLGRMGEKQCFVTSCDAGVFHSAAGLVLKVVKGALRAEVGLP